MATRGEQHAGQHAEPGGLVVPVRPGTYDVAVTWPAVGGLSAAVGFDVYDGLSWKKQVAVNEQVAPTDVTDQGVKWKDLGNFTVTSNVLHLSTWNLPTDGPHLRRRGPHRVGERLIGRHASLVAPALVPGEPPRHKCRG